MEGLDEEAVIAEVRAAMHYSTEGVASSQSMHSLALIIFHVNVSQPCLPAFYLSSL
jgi:hypothetical protein